MSERDAPPEVKATQVWADNDWRSEGRTLRVDSVLQGYVGEYEGAA